MNVSYNEQNSQDNVIEKSAILIQRTFRKKSLEVKYLNNDLYFTYYCLLGVMKRLRDSFRYDILTQYHYYHNMEKLEEILDLFSKIRRPLTMSYIYFNGKPNLNFIHKPLIDIVSKCGALTIFDIIKLNFGVDPILVNSEYRLMTFYNKAFNPTSCVIYDLENMDMFDYSNKESDAIAVYNSKNRYDAYLYDVKIIHTITTPICHKIIKHKKTLVEFIRGGRLYVPIMSLNRKQVLVMNGYFIEDSLNISRIGGIMEKKNKQLQIILNNLDIDASFKSGYIEQLSLRDFVIYSCHEISARCLEAYNECQKLLKKTFSALVKEFVNTDTERQRYIITLLLLMKNDKQTQYLAYCLYDIISNESYLLKPQSIGEKIFNSLHWSIQKKFKVIVNQINKYTQELNSINEDDISYKKKIMLMKAPDHIKKKAMEKYKEVSSKGANDNSSKPQQYLDGLIKIPFGVYRKEYMINFLSEFQTEIHHFIYLLGNYLNHKSDMHRYLIPILNTIEKYQHPTTLQTSYTSYAINNLVQELEKSYQKWESLNLASSTPEELESLIRKLLMNFTLVDLKQSIAGFTQNQDVIISISGNKKKIIDNYLSSGAKLTDIRHHLTHSPPLNNLVMKMEDITYQQRFQSIQKKWNQYQNTSLKYIDQIDTILNEAIYGQSDAKIQIKRIIGQWINGTNEGYCFGFEGYPGTGKTSLAKKGIAHCLKDDDGSPRPFAFIALGGSTHGATLEGHSYTYVGSTWGKIVDVLMETQCMNPIIFIDELDKVSNTEHGKEIIGILTHLTDSSQNTEFCDKYFGIKLDVSKCLFIFSYNDASKLDPILADRIHKVNFKPLSLKDKIVIAQKYIIPEIMSQIGFDSSQCHLEESTIQYLIMSYTHEAGVRKLKEKIIEIFREINLRYLTNKNETIIITPDLISSILPNSQKIVHKTIGKTPIVGMINGMFATSLGLGGLTVIQSCLTPANDKLHLQLTGQQGDVMQESMKVAKTLALRIIPADMLQQLLTEMDQTGKMGIHVHCPEGATQKDGPSAGTAITVCLISLLTKIPILNTIAITGEIDMMGNVMAIGGLDIKIMGAKLAGVKTIICPQQNRDVLEEIKKRDNSIIDESINIIMVSNIWQVLDLVLTKHNVTFQKF